MANNFGMMGGLTNFKFLTAEPWTIKLNLNEWVRFTQPGEYSLIVSSSRVEARDSSNALGMSPVTGRSNKITLKMVAGTPAWQKKVFDEAVATLDSVAPANRSQPEESSRRRSLDVLRFLGTPEAIRELAKRMRGEDAGGLDYICSLGLMYSPERRVARDAVAERLNDPTHPISSNFLYALRMLNSEPGATNVNWQEEHGKAPPAAFTELRGCRPLPWAAPPAYCSPLPHYINFTVEGVSPIVFYFGGHEIKQQVTIFTETAARIADADSILSSALTLLRSGIDNC